MNSEIRSKTRVNPPVGSSINNMLTNKPLGDLLNISSDGFMLSTKERIESGEIYQLSMRINVQPEMLINIGAECMWTESHGSRMDLGGFFIMDISDSDQQLLLTVIQKLTADH